MKPAFLAVPAVALFATGVFAQTDTTTGVATGIDTGVTVDTTIGADTSTTAGMDASAESFGTNWPLSVGTTFFSGADTGTLRTTEEISSGWQSLSQEDRDMIMADCVTFMAVHGDASTGAATSAGTDAATGTSTDTTAGASTDAGTATTGTATDTTAGASTGTASTEGTIATAVGYDLVEMKAICEAVEKF